MLDFSYVEQCRDLDTLKAIVARLSTGEEKVVAHVILRRWMVVLFYWT